jgi:large subunit ribosomal protein L29
MKVKEMREFGVKELLEKIAEKEEELFNLRFQAKMGQLSNPVRKRILGREIARAKTVIVEKQRSTEAKK